MTFPAKNKSPAKDAISKTHNPQNIHTSGAVNSLYYIREGAGSLVFTNLVDFDMLYGHRNNVEGYAEALEQFDRALPEMRAGLGPDDMLIITADHGCDPTFPGTDHTREYIPLLVSGAHIRAGVDLGTRKSFADIGATVFEYLTGETWNAGTSFLGEVWKD